MRAPKAADLSVEQVEKIVREYLLREPEIVYQALEELQRRQAEAEAARQQAAIADNRSELLDAPTSPVGGNPDGDVTLVEFFDYRCAYCRRVVLSMRALLDEDRELRVVFKELPGARPDSERAARAALASRRQGGYVPFHFALMAADDLSLEGIRAAAEAVGLDADRLEADMASPEVNAAIEANYALANELGIEGTPAFVIGDAVDPGRGRQGPPRGADPGAALRLICAVRRPATPLRSDACAPREAVAERQHRQADPLVALQLGVQCAQRFRLTLVIGRVRDRAAPEHVVEQDQAAGAHQVARRARNSHRSSSCRRR